MGIVSGFIGSISVADGIVWANKKQYRVEYTDCSSVRILFRIISTTVSGGLVLVTAHQSI
jgi:hypothetical protein